MTARVLHRMVTVGFDGPAEDGPGGDLLKWEKHIWTHPQTLRVHYPERWSGTWAVDFVEGPIKEDELIAFMWASRHLLEESDDHT